MNIKHKILEYSKPLRHDIARLVAPTLLKQLDSFPRPMIEYLYATGRVGGVGVEIGVRAGLNAKSIFDLLKPSTLFLIDSYAPYLQNGRVINSSWAETQARNRLKQYGTRAVFIIEESGKALKILPPLDFVYIDGNHNFDNVYDDLLYAWHNLKHGGVLGGHDFNANFIGVCDAVLGFASEFEVKIQGRKSDYWIVKP